MSELPAGASPTNLHKICRLLRSESLKKSYINREIDLRVDIIRNCVEYGCLLGFLYDHGEKVSTTTRGSNFGYYDEICKDTQELFINAIREYNGYCSFLRILYQEELKNIEVQGYIDELTALRQLRLNLNYQTDAIEKLVVRTFFKTLEAAGFGEYKVNRADNATQLEVSGIRGKFKRMLNSEVVEEQKENTGTSSEKQGNEAKDLYFPSQELDKVLSEKCLPKFEQGHYQSAVRTGFIILEERIRDEGGFSPDAHGTELVVDAFNPNTPGPLSFGTNSSEKEGMMFLYKGAMQALRNPASHRYFENLNQRRSYDILCLLNLLLSFIDDASSETSSSDNQTDDSNGKPK